MLCFTVCALVRRPESRCGSALNVRFLRKAEKTREMGICRRHDLLALSQLPLREMRRLDGFVSVCFGLKSTCQQAPMPFNLDEAGLCNRISGGGGNLMCFCCALVTLENGGRSGLLRHGYFLTAQFA
jgi:hypothetical protein